MRGKNVGYVVNKQNKKSFVTELETELLFTKLIYQIDRYFVFNVMCSECIHVNVRI